MKRAFLYTFIALGTLLLLFVFGEIFLGTGSESASGVGKFEVEMNAPYFATKASRSILVYNRVFHNNSNSHLIVNRGEVCVKQLPAGNGLRGEERCGTGKTDYFLGPSSQLVQTNQHVVLGKGAEEQEITLSYWGTLGEGGDVVYRLILLVDENQKIRVKEGLEVTERSLYKR